VFFHARLFTPSAGSDQDLTNEMQLSRSVVCKQSNAAFSRPRARKIPQLYGTLPYNWSAYNRILTGIMPLGDGRRGRGPVCSRAKNERFSLRERLSHSHTCSHNRDCEYTASMCRKTQCNRCAQHRVPTAVLSEGRRLQSSRPAESPSAPIQSLSVSKTLMDGCF